MKRDFLDAAFSDLVRMSYNWTCQKCHKHFEGRDQNCHCSHFYSRGAGNSVRWNIDNAICLCGTCHDHVGKYPDEHTALFRRIVGDVVYEELKLCKQRIVKLSKQDKKEMAAHFRAEYARIESLRKAGEVGYIRPVAWN